MKQEIWLALVLTLLPLILGTAPANCQETVFSPTASANADLPDVPSSTQTTTCTKNNGQPCPEWLHKVIGQHPPLPDSRELQSARDPSTVHFWTYRTWDELPLRNNRQVFRSKLFVGAHIGGAIAMVLACRNRHSGEEWHSEIPAVAGLFGMDYLTFRFIGGPSAIAAPIFEMIHYGQAAAK